MRRAATTGALVLALTSVAAPAVAATYTHQDAKKDVVLTDAFDVGPAPANKEADITKITVTHSGTQVRSVVTLRDITKARKHNVTTSLRVKVGTKLKQFDALLQTDPGDLQGDLTLYLRDGTPVSCPGLVSDIDYGKNVVAVNIPRSCIGKPTWVRAGVSAEWIPSHDDYYSDNGLKKAGEAELITYSTKIKKG